MKIHLLFPILFLSACAQAPLKTDVALNELEALLSQEDLKIHRCLNSGKTLNYDLKKECLAGTAYESFLSRTPSSDDVLIMKNNWFFDSKENVQSFYKMTRGFLRASSILGRKAAGKLVNKKGIAVEGSAYVGVGRGWAAEFVVHQNKLGFFCSPSWALQTDVGVEADFAVSRTLSCADNKAFGGQDISFSASISGELIGLPVGLGLSYSLSVDKAVFGKKISEARQQGHLNFQSLNEELKVLNSVGMKSSLAKSHRHLLALLTLAMKPLSLYSVRSPALSDKQGILNFVREMIKNDQSVGALFKSFYARELKAKLLAERLPNINSFLGALDASLGGCDTLGGSASVGVSLSPVSMGVSYSETTLLAEAGAPDLATFGSVTAMALLNPFLLPSQDLRNILKVARSFVAIPNKIARQCFR